MERPSIKDIVLVWLDGCGIWKKGDGGTPYKIICPVRKLESFEILYKTFVQYKYTPEEINDPHLSNTIARTCWQEKKIVKMSKSEVKEAQNKLADDWNDFLRPKISGIVLATLEESEKIIIADTPKTEPKKNKPEKILTEEEMMEIASLPDRLKTNSTTPKLNEDQEEIDTEFLEFMGLPVPDEGSK